MWMPAQTTVAPLPVAASAAGTRLPTGAKRSAASSGAGGASSEAPAQAHPSSRAKACERDVARAREGEHLAPLGHGDLRDEVRGGAEAVEAERARLRRHRVGAIADEPGAQEGCRVQVVVGIRKGEAEALVGHRVAGITAVAVIAGEDGVVAEVLVARRAVAAMPAGAAQPRDADPLARPQARSARAEGGHAPDHLVARNDRGSRAGGRSPSSKVQVGAAHAAGRHLDEDFAGARNGNGAAPGNEGRCAARRGSSRGRPWVDPTPAATEKEEGGQGRLSWQAVLSHGQRSRFRRRRPASRPRSRCGASGGRRGATPGRVAGGGVQLLQHAKLVDVVQLQLALGDRG